MANLPKATDTVQWADKKYRVVKGGDGINPLTNKIRCPQCKSEQPHKLIVEFTQYGIILDQVTELFICSDCDHAFGLSWDYMKDE